MIDDNSAWADEVLRRVRASAGPRPSNEARVLAGLERRLGIAAPLHLPDGDAAELAPAHGPAAPSLAGRLTTTANIARLATPLGLGAVFGLATGAVGYWWGSQSQASRVDSSLPALSIPAEAGQPAALVPAPRQFSAATEAAASEPPAASLAGAGAPSGLRAEPALPRAASNQVAPHRAAPVAPPRVRSLAKSENAELTSGGPEAAASAGAALTLREAILLLQRAQTALRRGEALEALELVSQLDQRSTGSMLREERLVTRALALCEMGDLSSGREALQELAGDEAQSIYRARLEARCGLAADDKK